MFSTLTCMSLLFAAQGKDLTLEATTGSKDAREFAFVSTPTLDTRRGGILMLVITETVTNHTEAETLFSFKGGEKVVVAAATKRLAYVAPRSVTMARTSYRMGREVSDNPKAASVRGEERAMFAAERWRESGAAAQAFPGGILEAKLIEGDAKGKALVRCLCAVTGSKDKGYAYAYTVENLTENPLRFKWAGLEGEIGPKRDFLKVEQSKELMAEASDLAILNFGDQQEFIIRANFWARPK